MKCCSGCIDIWKENGQRFVIIQIKGCKWYIKDIDGKETNSE